MTLQNSPQALKDSAVSILRNENGSVIVIALILLVLMSVVGVSSTDNQVTESLIVRNTAIHKQNVLMVDAVGIEAIQRVKDAGYLNDANSFAIPQIDPGGNPLVWVHDENVWSTWAANWYDPTSGQILDTNNSIAPRSLDQSLGTDVARILADRGEANGANSNLRYALSGWYPLPGDSIKETETGVLRAADILVEYVSADFGLTRLTLGVRKRW